MTIQCSIDRPRILLLVCGMLGAFAVNLVGCDDTVATSSESDDDSDASVDWTLGTDGDDDGLSSEVGDDLGTIDFGDAVEAETTDTFEEPPPNDCFESTEPDQCEADPACRWLVPGCQDEPDPDLLAVEGCYPIGDCSDDGDCAAGTSCILAVIDPCWSSPCGVCAEPVTVCTPTDRLCGGEQFELRFTFDTAVEPVEIEPYLNEWYLEGTVTYHGEVVNPPLGPLEWERELVVAHEDGEQSTVYYTFPLELDVPVGVGSPVQVTLRMQQLFEQQVSGLLVTRPTSGVHPLLVAAETGPGSGNYRVFEDDEPLMSPLTVVQAEDMDCPPRPDPECGGTIYSDQLVFDTSTGAAIIQQHLFQGEVDSIDVFGNPFTIVNAASTRIQPSCPDDSGGWMAYVAVRQNP